MVASIMPDRSEAAAYIGYLAAKKAIDDRCLNRHGWATMQESLSQAFDSRTLHVFEIGCGIGTMAERFLAHWTAADCEYLAVDREPAFIEHARGRFPEYAASVGYSIEPRSELEIRLTSPRGRRHRVRFEVADALHLPSELAAAGAYDLIISHAFLDLVDITVAVPALLNLLRPAGYFYFTLVFDGLTEFLPLMEDDSLIMELYHRSMDERVVEGVRSGHSQTGRRLYSVLQDDRAHIQAMGASDWVVMAQEAGSAENIFLASILDTVQDELATHPELDRARFEAWIEARRQQLASRKLVYITHQLDYFGQVG
jgi:SAM-dependent methyltransferase